MEKFSSGNIDIYVTEDREDTYSISYSSGLVKIPSIIRKVDTGSVTQGRSSRKNWKSTAIVQKKAPAAGDKSGETGSRSSVPSPTETPTVPPVTDIPGDAVKNVPGTGVSAVDTAAAGVSAPDITGNTVKN
ncbi:MAG: hypothetical protein J5494_04690, partial [Candidatus Methanomethylophilaceae archaeon]|nr:hypothetical protein [Candidatus Methanomethylophilaceae archaeon]